MNANAAELYCTENLISGQRHTKTCRLQILGIKWHTLMMTAEAVALNIQLETLLYKTLFSGQGHMKTCWLLILGARWTLLDDDRGGICAYPTCNKARRKSVVTRLGVACKRKGGERYLVLGAHSVQSLIAVKTSFHSVVPTAVVVTDPPFFTYSSQFF